MPARPKKTKEAVRIALEKAKGRIFLAAKSLEVSGETVRKYLQRWPELQEIIEDIRGRALDVAEVALDRAVIAGEAWAVCFFLKTQGKARGYIEKVETSGTFQTHSSVQVYLPQNDRDQTTTGSPGEIPRDVG